MLKEWPNLNEVQYSSAYNLTLFNGTGGDCYVRLEQPSRGKGQGFQSQEFTVKLADDSGPIYYDRAGSYIL